MTSPQPSPQSALYAAMCAASAEMHAVAKSGRNDFHNYDYATEADITQAVRPILARHGLCWFPSVVEHTSEALPNSKRGERLSTVTMEIVWCHSSGGTMTTRWVGQGADAGDKGYYKAYTGAIKYALLKTFMIPTGDDPEQEAPTPPPVKPKREERESSTIRPQRPAAARAEVVSRVRGALAGTDLQDKEKEVFQHLAEQLGMAGPRDISEEMWSSIKLQLPVSRAEAGHLLARMMRGEQVFHV